MTKIVFVEPSGVEHEVDAKPGRSVMAAAKVARIPGIVAECGGILSCGTCHVYVDEQDLARLPLVLGDEQDMLENVLDPKPNSRLSCQLLVTDELEGLRITIPVAQL